MDDSPKALDVIGTSTLDDVRSARDKAVEYTDPSDRVEFQLVQIWQQILNIHRLSVTDNFFELGGDSLQAARLLVEAEKMCGKKFSLRMFIDAPTVELMARAIRDEGWSPTTFSLVAIKPQGTKPPLFLVPGGNGEAFSSMHLVSLVEDDRPLYALRARELDGQSPPHPDLATMARDYIKEIRTVQPVGPYFLSGHCIGGIVALEMGQQLIEQGEQVALMLVLDLIWYRMNPKVYYAQRLRLHLNQLRQMNFRDQILYFFNVIKTVVTNATAAKLRPTYGRVVSASQPRGYQGRVTLLLSEKMYEYQRSTLEEDWRGISQGGLEFFVIPGDHDSFLKENLPDTTNRVRWCIANAETQAMPSAMAMQPVMA